MAQNTDRIVSELGAALARQSDVRLAVIFGSFVSGTPDPDSDVDLAVLTSGPLSAERKSMLIRLSAGIAERPIDLIDLWAVGEPLLGRILQTGQRIAGSETAWAEIIARHLLDSADFLPHRDRILRERRQAWTG